MRVCIHLPSVGLVNCWMWEISYSMNDSSAIIRKISRPARCASRSARSLFHFSSLKGSVSCKSSPVVVAQLGVLQITLSVPKYDSLGKVFMLSNSNAGSSKNISLISGWYYTGINNNVEQQLKLLLFCFYWIFTFYKNTPVDIKLWIGHSLTHRYGTLSLREISTMVGSGVVECYPTRTAPGAGIPG